MKTQVLKLYLAEFCVLGTLVLTMCSCQERLNPSKKSAVSPNIQQEFTPSKKPTVTLSITETSSPSLTITPSFFQTFDATQALDEVQRLLNQNENCQYPCFWGIIPGQTTLGQASERFERLQSPLIQISQNNEKKFYSTFNDNVDNVSGKVTLTVENNIVKNIYARITLAVNREVQEQRIWKAFTPDEMIAEYGLPSEVEFSINFPTENFGTKDAWYDMIFRYSDIDLIVEYYQGLTEDNQAIKVCPLTDQYQNVFVWLGKNPEDPPPLGVPLEEVSSFTLAEFKNLLTKNPQTACFYLPQSAFSR